MFCNQHHLNHSGNKLWARMFQTSLVNLLYYPHLLSMSFVMNVADIYHRHVMISALWEFDHLFLSYLVKLICVQSLHALVILISTYSNGFYRQHQSSLVWLLPATFDGWFAFLPLKSLSSESRDEILFRGEAVTVRVFGMLEIYFVSVNYVFVSIKLICVCVNHSKI
jgi:hypothetical protein